MNRRRQLLFCAAASSLLAGLCLVPLGPLQVFELKTLDLRFKVREMWRAPQAWRGVRRVALDDRSLNEVGAWPALHDRYAAALEALAGRQVAAVGLDLFLAPTDSINPQLRVADARLVAAAAAVRRAVVPSELPPRPQLREAPAPPARVLAPVPEGRIYPWPRSWNEATPAAENLQSGDVPVEPLLRVASRVGHAQLQVDGDGVLRRVPLVTARGGGLYPSLVLQVVCESEGIAPRDVEVRMGDAVLLRRDGRVVQRIPVDSAGCMLVNFHARGADGLLPLVHLARARTDPETAAALKDMGGKIVLFGTTARALGDFYPTPLSSWSPDIDIFSEAVETITSGRLVRRPPWPAQLLLNWAFLFAGAVLMLRQPPWRGVLVGLGLMVLYFVVEKLAFVGAGLWLDFVRPIFALQAAVVGFPLLAYWNRMRGLLHEMGQLRRFDDMILASMTNGVLVADRAGCVMKFNARAATLLRRDGESLEGCDVRELFSPCPAAMDLLEHAMSLADASLDAPRGGARQRGLVCPLPLHAPVIFPTTDPAYDRILTLSVTATQDLPWSSPDGRERCWVLTFNDVTEQIRLAQEDERRARLAAIGEIAAKLGHEIRNSLGGLRLYVENVREEIDASGAGGRAIDAAAEEIESLYRKIDELREYAREPRLDLSDCDLKQLVDEALAFSSQKLQEKRIRVTLDSHSGLPPLRADRRQLREAFQNIINNAVEASPAGGHLRIAVERLHGTNGLGPAGSYCVHIDDEGPGIAPEIGDQVFSLFFTTKPDVGTGLGLPIVKKIIESHGGRITFRSEEGVGTRFTVMLPPRREEDTE